MTQLTGSIGATANPGPALYAVIETAMLAQGWTLDDTVVIGGNTHKVLKSAAAGNARGLDFFIDINYPTTGITGGMRFAPFEGYTAASDVGLRGPFGHVSVTTVDATTYSRYGATTSALETNWLNTTAATAMSMTLNTTGFNYWINVTRNRIIAQTSLQSLFFYTGFFIPNAAHIAHAGAALFPLIMLSIGVNTTASSANSAGAANAAVTRLPKITSTINWINTVSVYSGASQLANAASGHPGSAVSEFTGDMKVVPLPVVFGNAGNPTSSLPAPLPAPVGELDGLAAGWILSTANRGDTISDGTDTWITGVPATNWALYMEAA